MIIRQNKINPSSKDVKFAVSFGLPDIRRWLRDYISSCTNNDQDLLMWLKSQSITEADMRYFLENNPFAFGWVENPWRTQLSAWAWSQMVKEDFLYPSATKEDGWIFTEKAFVRVGRPTGK